ncbi:adenylate/guanylate cyclase domain-containing protein [Mesorhizobium marinum]|uniref:adenylate/guanylate cyclase domain-containing protein n=1 Tax=Mesorhizobium marinum TaxID=3228790 RepID=UPI0034662B88
MSAHRKLAAILVADVVGYSRLAGADEDRTLARLRALRSDLIDPTIAVHNGRVVKSTGDGALVEFRSAVDAVRCAIEVQNAMLERNAGVPPDRRIEFRIGIHIGDVVEESDGDLMGDGVNIAARLEGVAAPGNICLSEDAYRQVRARLDLSVSDLGNTQLKNIAEPIRVYSVEVGVPAKSGTVAPQVARTQSAADGPIAPKELPDTPSIAVLPFTNLSSDPEQEYFSDGITEDIITDLSKIAGLMVVARNSSFAYKNRSSDIRVVGLELGVASVLEGSIRRAGNRVRITAQLIDAATGGHLWAERYDRDLADIFEFQDEVTLQIVEALKVKLRPTEKAILASSRTSNIEAHDCFLRGRELLLGVNKNREIFDRIVTILRRAIELDPDFAQPYAGLAMAHCLDFQNHWTESSDALDLAGHFANQAVDKGPTEPYAHYAAAVVETWKRNLVKAKSEAETALALNPNYALAYGTRGLIEVYLGHPLAAIPFIERAIRLDPVFTQQYTHFLGSAYLGADQYDAAAAAFRERIRLVPRTDLSRALLASALGHLGEIDEARRVWRELMEINPRYTLAGHLGRLPFQNQADLEKIREGLAKAELPD